MVLVRCVGIWGEGVVREDARKEAEKIREIGG